MAASNPPVNGVAFIVYVALQDMANPGSYKANPTLAAGDVQVSIDGGAFANLATLPAVTPAAGRAVKVSLSAAEMTGDNIFIQFVDQTSPKEWANYAFDVQTVASVWNVGKTGYALSAGGVQAIWDALTSALTTVGSIGKRLADDIDATISSRSTYAGGDTSGVTTLLTRIASALTITGGKVDVNDKTGFSLSAAGVQAIWDALTAALTTVGSIGKRLADDIDATISSRSTYAGGAVASVTGNVGGNVVGSVASVTADVGITQGGADKVWLSAARTLTSFGTLVADIWASATRTLTSFGTLAADAADRLLGRSLAGGSDGGRTVQDALRLLRNKRSIAAGTLTVTQEDDATPAWTAAIATAASNPTSSVDPA